MFTVIILFSSHYGSPLYCKINWQSPLLQIIIAMGCVISLSNLVYENFLEEDCIPYKKFSASCCACDIKIKFNFRTWFVRWLSKILTLTVYNSISFLSCKILKHCLSVLCHKQASLVYSSHRRQKVFNTINSNATSKLKQMFLS